ncbi:alpha-(1,3)-fucosyltransferase C [Drosophila rhopaloa]|uniref:Fucosyltransferase n=1 Tax=Drosophila rhopaloa TaxID=1041015 RepID=A0A6P4E3L1_DRORH|nr:alpha-(1,3)-fucosyltransferase C [Drosophila rhopaloa]XP_016972592.1 alpha-(1,3)-fucosyltransferase C [Drosophila rhopaloa]
MPIDKLRGTPVDKILSFRRNPDPQQQQQQQTDEMEDIPRFLPPQLLTEEATAKDTSRRMPDSDSINSEDAVRLPPPRRSPVSMRNLQRELYSPNQCMNVLKAIVAVVTICVLFATIPLYRRLRIEKETRLRMILLWNEQLMTGGTAHMECGCLVTTRRNHNDKPFDAVVFNADQPYSFAGLDSIKHTPDYYVVYSAKKPLSFTQNPMPGLMLPPFNLTMTYRLDSQLVWTDYYFSHPNLARRLNSFRNPSQNFGDDLPGSINERLESEISKKTRLAVYLWFDVDQNTLSESLYLEELRKYADLDAHDSCLGPDDCSHYHFMLIFETSACPDYVPSQMLMAMDKLIVPVLIGGGNLTNLVPPHSYISGLDFSTPKDLIDHLIELTDNREEYRRYFWWHSIYKLRQAIQPYCALCSLIQKAPEERQIRQGSSKLAFINWWTEYQCPNRSTTFL